MNGLWKENIGGWNNKDTKRKKQSRKHILKDKGRALLKVYDSWFQEPKEDENIFREEGAVLWIKEKSEYKKQNMIEVCRVLVDNYDYKYSWFDDGILTDGFYQGKPRMAYNFRDTWYDYFDDSKISGHVKKVSVVDIEGIIDNTEAPKPSNRRRRIYWGRHYIGGTNFLYNKPLPSWKRTTFYSDGKSRKLGQNIAHSADRGAVKTYIGNADWDAEIKTHDLSKTIAWFVH